MDTGLSAATLLTLWERGCHERTGARALTLLGAARPDLAAAELGEIPIGGRDAALLDLRERLFGRRFTGVTTCPSCRTDIELSFDASEVRRHGAAGVASTMASGAYEIAFHVPTARDAVSIDAEREVEAARRRVFASCIDRAVHGGDPVAAADLPPAVVEAVAARMSELDPQADVPLDLACPECGGTWREPFDVVTYLWQELSVWARRLLADVHVIASGYGWSEAEILELPPVRRAAYLEMLR